MAIMLAASTFAQTQTTIKHEVKAGETLSSIARAYNTTVEELLKLNPKLKPDYIMAGQNIIVVKGTATTATTEPETTTPAVVPTDAQEVKETVPAAPSHNEAKPKPSEKPVAILTPNQPAEQPQKLTYGRNVTDFASKPKFGGYFIGKYSYSDKPGSMGGDGFSQRMMRAYVDGTILNDFKYRVQVQASNSSFHMKDVFVEWTRVKEASIKVGQFKRAFTFENPYNPWDVGTGDYAQLTKKLAGMGDYCGESSSNGGRDQGIQLQGDLFPVGKSKYRLVHYQLAMYNGQGINTSDKNKNKDYIGTFQLQPFKDLYIGAFGWLGDYTANVVAKGAETGTDVTVDRIRYAFGTKYEHKGWTVRGEYAHSYGHKISDHEVESYTSDKKTLTRETGKVAGTGRADAWYATVGVPVTPWMKIYTKYDVYREDASWKKAKTIYSVAPNFQLHKNLLIQLQYNFTHDRTMHGRRHDYQEVWAETYVRF